MSPDIYIGPRVLLTPNRRMAQRCYQAEPSTKSQLERRRVYPINTWLEQLFLDLSSKLENPPKLFNLREEEIIWENIIRQSEWGKTLLKTSGAAKIAREAWVLCHQWCVPLNFGGQLSEEHLAFLEWAESYQQYCRDNHWIDFSKIIPFLMDALENGTFKKILGLPQQIQLVGFEEIVPQYAQFIDVLKKMGVKVDTLKPASITGNQKFSLCMDTLEEELRAAAMQCKNWLQDLEGKPKGSIGVVIPDLESRRQQVVRIFGETIPKASFNVAAPIPLSEYPFIEAALLVLSFLTNDISVANWSRFLTSPFFKGSANELFAKSALDISFRQTSETTFSFRQILARLERTIEVDGTERSSMACSDLYERMKSFIELVPKIWLKNSATAWRELFTKLLATMGWPGDRTLNAEELELSLEWEQLLLSYEGMGRVLGEHTAIEAIQRLTRLANATPFLPVSPDCKVQVLGLLEAVGLPFDYLWVTGMHREAWPMDPAPNPFIPLSLQKQFDLPRNSAKRELTMAKKFLKRFFQSADYIIFSYPKMIEDKICHLTPLLWDIPKIHKDTLGLSNPTSYLFQLVENAKSKSQDKVFLQSPSQFFQTSPFDLSDQKSERGPSLHEREQVLGGVNFLKLQALCPFRAFAEIRLQATSLPKPITGLSAAERGELVHQVLQYFWQSFASEGWQTFKTLSTETLSQRIKISIEEVFKNCQIHTSRLMPVFATLEKERLLKVLLPFMVLEQKRPAFKVLATEKEKTVKLANIQFRIRLDRIDQLENGETLLIDYKTGEASIRNWFNDRPTEPQLPLYCIIQRSETEDNGSNEYKTESTLNMGTGLKKEPKTEGIVYAIVRADGVKYQGLTAKPDCLPGVNAITNVNIEGCLEDWEAQLDSWEETLEKLALDFSGGVANVDPLQGQNTCRTCSLKTVCRINSNPA